MAQKKLTRSTNKMLAGVCGGIAEFFEVDPTLIRVAYAALSIFTTGFPGLLLYLILMLIMPAAGSNDGQSNIQDAEVVE
ncbi:MAG: PspC domain-containing protein [Paludibacteraceae bacterium]